MIVEKMTGENETNLAQLLDLCSLLIFLSADNPIGAPSMVAPNHRFPKLEANLNVASKKNADVFTGKGETSEHPVSQFT